MTESEASVTVGANALPSWREGAARQAIVDFVTRVAGASGSPVVSADV